MFQSNESVTEEVRILLLHENDDRTEDLYRLKTGWTLQIQVSPEFSWRKIRIFSNVSPNIEEQFNRQNYTELKWIYPSYSKYDDSDRYVLIQCIKAGTFHYYFTIDGTTLKENSNGQGYIQIEPKLIFSTGSAERLDQDEITCQSVLSKSLGPMSEWLSRLEVGYHSGYNIIHFTPIQLLYSVSNSSYAITNHHQLNPLFNGNDEELKKIIDYMSKEWGILSITDLVYNHAANDCSLLRDHPESAYNLINSPHLKPAVLLDSILMQFTVDVSEGKLLFKGISPQIEEHHLQIIRHYFLEELFPKYRFWEFYICDSNVILQQFRQQLFQLNHCPEKRLNDKEYSLHLIHGNYSRMKTTIDFDLAEKIYYYQRENTFSKEDLINVACDHLKDRLDYLNNQIYPKVNEDLNHAIENCLASCRYHFFSYDGPNYQKISLPSTPFVGNYFHYPNDQFLHPDQIDQLIEKDISYQSYVMAHNGWVMNDNPLRSFADEGQSVYFCRDLLQWSDIIKLRFGSKREDSPALYDYMKEYTRLIATNFHGCRLDNCHSTPLWLAQELMDYAREINPNFYINAELFTGNIQTDTLFINLIGINSLVRESYRAFDPYELGQISSSVSVGDPMGSFLQKKIHLLEKTKPYSWFYDQTHDNPSQIERRSLEDVLPRSAIVALSNCSTGSNRGYDELVPHHIDVVHETRFYPQWGNKPQQSNQKTAMISLKKALNKLHVHLAKQGFNQFLVDQLSTSVLLITRHNPLNHKSVLLLAYTSFSQPSEKWDRLNPLSIEGIIDEIILEGSLKHRKDLEPIDQFKRSEEYINGLDQTEVYFKENLLIEKSSFVHLTSPNSSDYRGSRTIEFTENFRPGSIIVIEVSLLPHINQSLTKVKESIKEILNPNSELNEIVQELTLVDLERILYRSSNEEQSDGKGFDVYSIPDYGQLVYAGLHGQIVLFNRIRLENQLKHPFITNIKQGNWLMEYISNRLKPYPNTNKLGDWYGNVFKDLGSLSRLMIPCYLDLILREMYDLLINHSYSLMSQYIRQSSLFVHQLSQSSIELLSIIPSARLPLLSPRLKEPRPIEEIDEQSFERIQQCPSLAAGFPHFSSGIWRNWGRDTFLSLRGLLLLTGRYEEARYLILSYGSCLRHGLIPNLLGDGRIARYNSRDAVWWWLYSIQSYTEIVSDGYDILNDRISRFYPTNDSPYQNVGLHEQSLYDLIQEVFLRHLQSLSFRERGAGYSLDSDINDQGFNNQISIDLKNGFIQGGNEWNCGTWMDKMGSSEKAKNKGHPATPRDGSPIELIGLSRTIIQWIIQANEQGFYPYDSIETSTNLTGKVKFLFKDWLKKIDENFEKEFWISEEDCSEFVHRKNIYKDTLNSTFKWTDFQFRPNFLVAAVLAPQMFDKTHIWLALTQVERILLGKYGIKTLDPSDLNYVPDYDNSDDSWDYKRARGFNYHNGPEWLWLTGYYIRAKLYWAKKQDDRIIFKQTIEHLKKLLSSLNQFLSSTDWNGLPELTDADGKSCSHSCHVQAWSAATLIEAIYDLSHY